MENIPVEKKSKKNPWTKVWVSLGVLLFVVVGVCVFEYFRITPNNVYFTNVTSNSITVSWNTKMSTSASVLVTEGEKKIPVAIVLKGERYFDTRDVTNAELEAAGSSGGDDLTLTIDDFDTDVEVENRGSYYTHHVTVTNLDPETEYSFMVGDKYLFRSVEGLTKTLEVPDSVKSPVPAYGSVKDAKGENVPIDSLEALSDGVVYANYLDKNTGIKSALFSSVLNSSGNWYIDLSLAKDSEGNDFLDTYDTPNENVLLEITVDGGNAGLWQTRQFSYQISPVPDIVLNIPDSVQDLDVEGSVVPLDLEEVKGESTVILARIEEGLEEELCESNSLGRWNGSTCICVTNATLSGGKCECLSGYEWSRADMMCVSSTVTPPITKTCIDCTVSCKSGYTRGSCPSGSTCDEYTSSCTKQYSDGSGSCGTKTGNCYKVVSTGKELDDPSCAFIDYCACVHMYTDRSNSANEVNGQFNCTAENCNGDTSIEATAATRLCSYAVDEDTLPKNENLKCSGTYNVGAIIPYEGYCRECKATTQNNYWIAKWILRTDLNYPDECEVEQPQCSTVGTSKTYPEGTILMPLDELCEGGASPVSESVTFNDVTNKASWKCELNGIETSCESTRESTQEGPESPEGETSCDNKNQLASCDPDSGTNVAGENGLICAENENSYATAPYVCLEVGFNCTHWINNYDNFKYTINNQGQCTKTGVCKSDDYELKYEGGSLSCVLKEDSPKGIYSNQACWEANGIKLRASDGTNSYSCWDGVWEDRSSNTEEQCRQMVINGCASCRGALMTCYNENTGIAYGCWDSGNGYEWGPDCDNSFEKSEEVYDVDYEEVLTETPETISVNTQCLSEDEEDCICEGGVDNKVPYGLWCRGVAPRMTNSTYCGIEDSLEGVVCDKFDGTTCIKHPEDPSTFPYYYCYGDPPEVKSEENIQLAVKQQEFLISLLESKTVLGQSLADVQYIIDSQTGVFENIPVGSYMFEYDGEYYFFQKSNNGGSLIYLDTNDNKTFEENIDIKVSDIASEITIVALAQSYFYNLTEGLNFVSFPFLISNSEFRTAAGLLQKLNEVYGDVIYSISKFDGGKWKMVGQNVEIYDNNDFQLLPGVGYMIKAKEDVDISIVGQPIQYESESDSAPITLYSGWNLIGIYGTNVKSYTAKTLIQDINADDFAADNVTEWAKDKQMYEGFQLSDGEEYGFDFPLNKLESYFVRITQGSGNWQPELSSNN